MGSDRRGELDRAAAQDDAEVTIGLLRDTASALASAATTEEVLQRCAEAVVRWLGVAVVRVWTAEAGEQVFVLRASAGELTDLDDAYQRILLGAGEIGRVGEQRRPHLTNDVVADGRLVDLDWARRNGVVAFAGYPLLASDELVGVLGLFARRPLTPAVLATLATVADALPSGSGGPGPRRPCGSRARWWRSSTGSVRRSPSSAGWNRWCRRRPTPPPN